MIETPDRTESIFAAAVALATAPERDALLDRECAGDHALRGRVEALLRAHDRAGHLLDMPEPGSSEQTADHIAGEQPGIIIASRYKLLEAIGEGGMGTVWVAEQTQPVRRKVALKLIKAGMDSKSVLARFDAERQALAVMDHPNIAKVLDGGLTGGEPGGVSPGRPFFVMEYVKGVPITQYCDAVRLSIPERLNLFVQVCQAVQHAHQKGIIHRDLKPSNILVAPYDDRPVPKVIDFGLAKAMHQPLTELTLHTAHESVLGTPLYMSPEQAQLNNLDVDTRSDIYSLGVLLYELLTGTTPLERRRLKEAIWEEIRRLIREEEPPRPSARLSSAQTLPSLAASRQIEPAKLTKLVRGELDWIVMKSLEKDRTRRYDTANGFAMDIQRYLAGEPVLAAPPSARYRLRKFVRKYRTALTTAAALVLLLMTGVAVSSWQAVRATRAENAATERAQGEHLAKLDAEAKRAEAERQKAKAEKAAAAEKDANDQTQKRLKQIEKANEILGSIFENLDPREIAKAERPLQAILVEKLDKAVEQLDGESIGDPLVVAAMQNKFGVSLFGLGEPGKATVLLEKALTTRKAQLGPDHPDTLASMNNLAWAYEGAGKLDLALPLFEETLKRTKATRGTNHHDTLTNMNNLGTTYMSAGKLDLALPLLEETLPLMKAKLGREHAITLRCMNNLALAYEHAGKHGLAVPLLQETLEIHKAKSGPEAPDTLLSMNNLAGVYRVAGKLNLALPLYEEALPLMKAKLGPDHPITLTTMRSLALAYQDAGKLNLALPLLQETLKLSKAKLGPEHPDTLRCMNQLAGVYLAAGKLDLALPLFEETVPLMKAKFGPDHPDTFHSMNGLAKAYLAAGKPNLGLPLLEKTLKLMRAKLGTQHYSTLIAMHHLAGAYWAAGKRDLALPLWEETLQLMKAHLGPDHRNTILTMGTLGNAYREAGKPNLALPLLEETLQLFKAKIGTEDPQVITVMHNLALAYKESGKLDLALPLFEETVKLMKAKLGPEHSNTLNTMAILGQGYVQAGQGEKAVPLVKQLIAAQRKHAATNPGGFAGMLAEIGLDLLKCHQFAEAEPILRECLAIRAKTQPDAWSTFNTKSMLGGALLGQKKYADAEPLLLTGCEGMKKQEAKIPPLGKVRLTEAVERLVQLFEATGNNQEAARWRTEREAMQAAQKKTQKQP